MQIKSVIVYDIHYNYFFIFNNSTLFHLDFFLICSAEICVRLIHPRVL